MSKLRIALFLPLFFLFAGCGPNVRDSLKSEATAEVLAKSSAPAFICMSYQYYMAPEGFRNYGLWFSHTNENKDYYVYFNNKKNKDIVLLDVKPGTYLIKCVTYQGTINGRTYGLYPIYTNVTIEPNTVCYLGFFQIFKGHQGNIFDRSYKSKMNQYVGYTWNPNSGPTVSGGGTFYRNGGTTASFSVGVSFDADWFASEATLFDGCLVNDYTNDSLIIQEKYPDLKNLATLNVEVQELFTNNQ